MLFPALYPFAKRSESDARFWTSRCQSEFEDTTDNYVQWTLQERRKKAENLREGKQGGRRRAVTLIESGAERADSFLIVKAGVKGSTWIS